MPPGFAEDELAEEEEDSAADLEREPPDSALAFSADLGAEVVVACRMEREEASPGVGRRARRRRVDVKRCIVVWEWLLLLVNGFGREWFVI